jgi:intein/homing endonuclease
MTFQRIYPKRIKPTIIPTIKQHQAWEALKDPALMFIVFGAGAGTGKTWLGCEWLLTNCYFYPMSKWFIAREELKRLMTSTYITWCKVCAHHNIPKNDWDLNQKYNYIEFTSGSRIDLLDLKYLPSDPLYERLGSLEYTGGWIEEAGEIDFGAFDVLKSRINRHLNDKYNLQGKMLLTCNPTKRWLYSTVYKPFKVGALPMQYAFIPATYKDNPHTAERYGQMLAQIKDDAQKQRLMYGNWEYDDDPRSLIEFDAICDLFTNKTPKGEAYLTIDVARFGADKAVIMRWEGWQVKEIYVYPTCTITRLQAEAENICNTHLIPRSHVIADEDGVGCLTEGTEVMCVKGWKKAEDVKKGDKIYSKDEKGNMVIETVKENRKIEKMKVLSDDVYSFSFGHYLPYRSRNNYKTRLGSWDKIVKKPLTYLDNRFQWEGTAFDITIHPVKLKMPHGGIKVCSEELTIKGENFARFLGWFLSEGHIDGKYIGVTQSVNSKHNHQIEDVLTDCGFKFYKKQNDDEFTYMVCNKNLQGWLKQNCYTSTQCNALNIKAPQLLKWATPKEIRLFLNTYRDGDGYLHHGNNSYCTSSKRMADDLQELILKTGRYCNIRIKHKKGSVGVIEGRKITRTTDCYVIYEWESDVITYRPKNIKESLEGVYDIKITGPTRLYPVRFKDNRVFWVHNGGFVDNFKCKGFTNNSSPIQPYEAAYDKSKKLNYANLKTQCYFLLADKINSHACGIDTDKWQEYIKEELEQVKIESEIIEGKIRLVSKEEIKENIGRSPDFSDCMMMRSYFEIKKPTVASDNYEKEAISYINSVERPMTGGIVGVGVDYKEYQPATLDFLHNDSD